MFDWTWAVGVLYQNPPLDGLVRLDRLGSALDVWMGSALDLRKDLLYELHPRLRPRPGPYHNR